MLRFLVPLLLGLLVAGCQTGTDTDGALTSVAVSDNDTKAAVTNETVAAVPEVVGVPTELAETETKAEKPAPPPKTEIASTNGDPIAEGAAAIAKLRKAKGEKAAVEAVFACYEKARARSASLSAAQVCAAQDFALSRNIISGRKPNATGTGDRALFISKRHAARIGALMQLKGMGQAQFNTFGKYLHQVAEPAYQEALKS